MSRVASNLYAVTSLDPIVEDSNGITVMCCIPVDFDTNGLPHSDTRYETLLQVPTKIGTWELLGYFDYARAFAAQWLTYMWEVA